MKTAILATEELLEKFGLTQTSKPTKLNALIVSKELLEQAKSIHSLLQSECYAGIEPIARVAFTNYADLVNLLAKPEYFHYLAYMSLNQQRKYTQIQLESKDGKYEAQVQENLGISLQQMIDTLKQHMSSRKSSLTREYMHNRDDPMSPESKVNISDQYRFHMAGLSKEYDSLYRGFSSRSHGHIGTIAGKAIDGETLVWPPKQASKPLWVSGLLALMLAKGGSSLGKKFGKDHKILRQLTKRIPRSSNG